MTGICYFSDPETEYLAETQARATSGSYDSVMLLKESGSFTPEKADELISEASRSGCDHLVFIAESSLVPMLERLIPESYGDKFSSIEVLEEDYDRYYENDAAAPQTAPQVQQPVVAPAIDQQNKKLIVLADLGAPLPSMLGQYANALKQIVQKKMTGAYTTFNVDPSCPVVTWFSTVESAGLTAAGISALFKNFPGLNFKNEMIALDNNDMKDGSIELIIANHLQSNSNYKFIVPASQVALKSKYSNIVDVLPTSFENPNNSQIYKMMMILADSGKPLEKSSFIDKKDLSKLIETEKNKILYIRQYMAAISVFDSIIKKDKKIVSSKEVESELMNALKKKMADLSGLTNAAEYAKDHSAIVGDLIKVTSDIKNAMKKDLHKDLMDDDLDANEKKSGTRADESIVRWTHYKKLCELLGISK